MKPVLLRIMPWRLPGASYRVPMLRQDNVPARGGALLVSNHLSFVNLPLTLARPPTCPAREAAGRPAFLASGVPSGRRRPSHRSGADQHRAAAHDRRGYALAGRRTAADGDGGPALAANLY